MRTALKDNLGESLANIRSTPPKRILKRNIRDLQERDVMSRAASSADQRAYTIKKSALNMRQSQTMYPESRLQKSSKPLSSLGNTRLADSMLRMPTTISSQCQAALALRAVAIITRMANKPDNIRRKSPQKRRSTTLRLRLRRQRQSQVMRSSTSGEKTRKSL